MSKYPTIDWLKIEEIIDKIAINHAQKHKIPALSYGIIYNGTLVIQGANGLSNIERGIDNTLNKNFRIASMTKSLTAMAILHLHEDQQLNIHDPLNLWIPELSNWEWPQNAEISIWHLLCHMAGLPEDNAWGDRQLDISSAQFYDFIRAKPSFSTIPGTQYEYSNFGYALLGEIITKASKISFQKYITKNILTPLGMNHTIWDFTQVPESSLAIGYRMINDTWDEQPILGDGIYASMGGLISTIDDFAKYIAYHQSIYNHKYKEYPTIISQYNLRQMHHPWNMGKFEPSLKNEQDILDPTINAYGYGLYWMKNSKQNTYVGHSGSLPGYNSHWWMMPEYDIAIVSMANLKTAKLGAFNIAILNQLIADFPFEKIPILPSKILTERYQQLCALLTTWNGNLQDDTIFAMNFFLDVYLDEWKNQIDEIRKDLGENINIESLIPENNLRGNFLLKGTNEKEYNVFFSLTPEANPKIQVLQFTKSKK